MRTRIVGSVVALTALGMLLSGFATYTVLHSRLEDRTDEHIAQEINEFSNLVTEGIDPTTGEPLSRSPVARLFTVALQRNVPDENETLFALFDDEVLRTSARNPAPVYDDPTFRARLADVQAPVYGDLESEAGHVRYGAYPVLRDGTVRGVWVVAEFTGPERRRLLDAMVLLAALSAGALMVVGAIGSLVAARLLAPVRLVRQAAQQISESDFTRRIPVTGQDDVSELARTFNAMLDRLQDAFATQRQFLDDAGHELRTPITIVQGHLETADLGDPQERAETCALVLDELDRMSRLVEDLVMLAKSERPDFLRLGEVRLASMVEDVFIRARALATRDWELDIRVDRVLRGDRHRLTQALVQLAHNATKHTSEGDRITIGADAVGDNVRLWVADTGSGVHPADADRVFQRFQRGHDGRGAEGAGLGLAIVRAIAEAHDGHVTLDSPPGSGATVAIVMPAGDPVPALQTGTPS